MIFRVLKKSNNQEIESKSILFQVEVSCDSSAYLSNSYQRVLSKMDKEFLWFLNIKKTMVQKLQNSMRIIPIRYAYYLRIKVP